MLEVASIFILVLNSKPWFETLKYFNWRWWIILLLFIYMTFANTHPFIFMKVCISKLHLFELDKEINIFFLKAIKVMGMLVI